MVAAPGCSGVYEKGGFVAHFIRLLFLVLAAPAGG
jgi:hypothetical protein